MADDADVSNEFFGFNDNIYKVYTNNLNQDDQNQDEGESQDEDNIFLIVLTSFPFQLFF